MSQILTINAGSSSLKYAVFNIIGKTIKSLNSSGYVEKIGQKSQIMQHKYVKDGVMKNLILNKTSILTHKTAIEDMLTLLEDKSLSDVHNNISIIGHRVVHGGPNLTSARLIDDNVLYEIEKAIPLAPLHNPHNLHGITTALNLFPKSVKQIVEFDTSFHSTIPSHAHIYGIPMKYYKQHGIRRYGFHGISHEYVSKKAADLLGKPIELTNLISCHLGAGSSMACIQHGESIDTTMGFTPLEGLIMASRCGDIDAGVIFYLAKELKMSLNEIEDMLNRESGFYGLSGERDARDVKTKYKAGDEVGILTVDAMAHRIRKYIGAYHLNLSCQTDAIIFTAGMGENWSVLRKACMKYCDGLGFSIDENLNEQAQGLIEPMDISSQTSLKKVFVIPTSEERNIAEKALEIVG